jgi:YidB-like protein
VRGTAVVFEHRLLQGATDVAVVEPAARDGQPVAGVPNRKIAPRDREHALGGDTLDALSRQTGMDRNDLLKGLSQHLPELIDRLTPQGRLPTDDEASRMA